MSRCTGLNTVERWQWTVTPIDRWSHSQTTFSHIPTAIVQKYQPHRPKMSEIGMKMHEACRTDVFSRPGIDLHIWNAKYDKSLLHMLHLEPAKTQLHYKKAIPRPSQPSFFFTVQGNLRSQANFVTIQHEPCKAHVCAKK